MGIIESNHDPFFKDINNPWNIGGEEEVDKVHTLLKQGKIMDLGFGVGRHVKQLLDLGHEVDGIELSKIGYNRLVQDIKDKNQSAQLYHGDMFEYIFINQYDGIFANMTLQYAKDEIQFITMLEKIKKATLPGGINYIKLPAEGMTLDFPFKILDLRTLQSYYSDWEILFDNYEKIEKDDGTYGVYVTIISRKKS